jgi:hypothetical protein
VETALTKKWRWRDGGGVLAKVGPGNDKPLQVGTAAMGYHATVSSLKGVKAGLICAFPCDNHEVDIALMQPELAQSQRADQIKALHQTGSFLVNRL